MEMKDYLLKGKKILSLGKVVITPAARFMLHIPDIINCLERHQALDFGDISEADKETNLEALKSRGQIHSAYNDRNGTRFWIITEHDRSATTILLPSEY